ncbi:MAG: SusD/RagB family nutrient-binding outer membrane lipoprotein [Luteibaculum sp.]
MRKSLYTIFIMALVSFGCTKDFEEINTNPNAPGKAEPQLLLRQVTYDYLEQMSYEGFVAGNLLSQHFAMIDFNLFDRHSLTEPQLGGNPWPFMYRNLRDCEILLGLARSSNVYSVYEGPALVLKSYITMALTDIYGDVPYSQALKAKSGLINPAYDSQENIYTGAEGILANLRLAEERIEAYQGGTALQGDILFNGDLNGWLRFANSLRFKALMRISGVSNVAQELQSIVDAGNFIADASQNALYPFSESQPNNFRMARLRDGDFNLYAMSSTIEDILIDDLNNDPRLNTYFRTIGKDTTFDYNGILNGRDASSSIKLDTISLPGTIWRENAGVLNANYFSSWEMNFLLAEAAERGLISGSAKSYYDQGVMQSFTYWNTAMPANYLEQGNAAYGANGANPLEQILTQKWIASIIHGYEPWIEWRRTGFPQLKTVAASLNGNEIPVRMPYPTDEEALNADNYSEAAGNTNGNSVNVPVWWDNN